MNKILFSICVLGFVGSSIAQENLNPQVTITTNKLGQTITTTTASSFMITPPASEWEVISESDLPLTEKSEVHNNRKLRDKKPNFTRETDPVVQSENGERITADPIVNFLGQNGSGYPPDPSGAAGPDHYVQAVNTAYRIYSKTGGNVAGPFNLSTLWTGSSSMGDPIVMWDRHAQRWFISQFNSGPNRILIAISQTSDPTGAYYSYSFTLSQFPDYPKYSIWWDGYYMTSNSNNTAVVFERDKMINGDPTAQMIALAAPSLGTSGFRSVLPADADGDLPPNGTPCYFFNLEDNGWSGVSQDAIQVYEMDVDWNTTSNTAITAEQQLPVSSFDTDFGWGFDNISQPGTSQKLDAVMEIFYYRAQHRNWVGYNTITLCHVVDIDGNNRAAMRWYELRDANDGNWSVYQEGTYDPDNGNRWLGSICMDDFGNIGMAYCHTDPNNNEHAGLRFTGRLAGDPLGEMTFAEKTAHSGGAAQTGINRFGDYSHMSLDPDGTTFWFTGETLSNGGSPRTKIFSFDLQSQVGIEDANPYYANLEMKAYQNQNLIQVEVEGLYNREELVLDLINLEGKLIKHSTVMPSSKSLSTSIDISGLAADIYFVRIGNKNFQKVERLVIIK